MKIIVISLLLILSDSQCSDKFDIINTTSQEWKGGRQETGYGTYYEMTIVPEVNSTVLIFDELWIGELFFQIQCYQKGKRVKNNTFGPGDTITIRVNDRIVPKEFQKENDIKTDSKNPPKKYRGDALLSYTLKGIRKYKIIEKFTKIKPVYYP